MSDAVPAEAIFHIVYLERAMLIVKRSNPDWRELRAEFADYKASLGPWEISHVADFLIDEYPRDPTLAGRVASFPADVATVLSL